MKLERIERDMQKTRDKITDLQNHLKELDAQKTEIENLQIVQAVRAMRLTKEELAAFLRGDIQPAPAYAEPAAAHGYQPNDEQEDSEDEEV